MPRGQSMEKYTEDARKLKKPRLDVLDPVQNSKLDQLYDSVQTDVIEQLIVDPVNPADLGDEPPVQVQEKDSLSDESFEGGLYESDSEDGIENDGEGEHQLEDWQEEVLDEMEKSLEIPPEAVVNSNGQALVIVPTQEATAIRTNLWKLGPSKFLAKYQADPETKTKYSSGQLLSALGFRLPVDFVAKFDKKNETQDGEGHVDRLAPFLLIATRHALSSRQRLAYPHTLDDLAEVLEKAKNIIVLTGAGISTSLGIPDFRSESGLYSKLAHLGLSDPQEVFDIDIFRDDPSIFYSMAKDVLPETERFSPTHAFIKLLQDRGILLRNYTQNIDNLESYAGVDKEKLVQCHGSFATATCISCKLQVEGSTLFPEIRQGLVPKCPNCAKNLRKQSKKGSDDENDIPPSYGVMKPDITFFGEPLPKRFEQLLLSGDAQNCDLLICIGTSLKVAPVSEIVRILPPRVPQIYISKAAVYHNEFDVTFLGSCDDAVELLCQKMNWPLEHEMTRRAPGTPLDEFPDGKVEFSDDLSLYKFVYDRTQGVEISAPIQSNLTTEVNEKQI